MAEQNVKPNWEEKYMYLFEEWDVEANLPVRPSHIAQSSLYNAHWKCRKTTACGCVHRWRACVRRRAYRGQGCPFCSGTVVCPHESLEAVKPKIAAFWHPTSNKPLLASQVAPRSKRRVWWYCPITTACGCPHQWMAAIATRDDKCAFCTNRHNAAFCFHDTLAHKFPEIAKQWHPDKNGSTTPADVTAFTHRAAWWLCPKTCPMGCAHSWQMNVADRTAQGQGCPFCAVPIQRLCPHTNFAAIHPALLLEWDQQRNGKLDPATLAVGSKQRVWWKCSVIECGLVWQAAVDSRTARETGCPACNTNKGERNVRATLRAIANVTYEEQVRFPDLKFKLALKYDFGNIRHPRLLRLAIIESDGIFHFPWLLASDGEILGFDDVISTKRDLIKNKFASTNGMHLLRIGYKHIERLADVTRIIHDFFLRCEQHERTNKETSLDMVSDRQLYNSQRDHMKPLLTLPRDRLSTSSVARQVFKCTKL